MNILVLSGSPRRTGNSAAFAEAFRRGAESVGHQVTVADVGNMKIGPCMACEYCHTAGAGQCVQQDDMQELYPMLAQADMVVFASAVHYWGFTGQLQSAITRFYAPNHPAAKKYAMILSSASENVYDGLTAQYRDMVDYFNGESLGIFTFNGENQQTEENLSRLYQFGASL